MQPGGRWFTVRGQLSDTWPHITAIGVGRFNINRRRRNKEPGAKKSGVFTFEMSAGDPQIMFLRSVYRRAHENAGGLHEGNRIFAL